MATSKALRITLKKAVANLPPAQRKKAEREMAKSLAESRRLDREEAALIRKLEKGD